MLMKHQQDLQGCRKPNYHLLRRALQALLPVSIISLALSYSYSCLPCYLHSVTSLLHILMGHFTTRKAILLFSNVVLLVLTIEGSSIAAAAAAPPTTFLNYNNPFDDEACLSVTEKNDHLVLSDGNLDSIYVEEHIVEKRVIEESVVMRKSEGEEFSVEGNELVVKERSIEESDSLELVVQKRVQQGARFVSRENTLESTEGDFMKKRDHFHIQKEKGRDFPRAPSSSRKLRALVVEDNLDLLDLDELNRRFDEFIEREKRKRRSEAVQLILV